MGGIAMHPLHSRRSPTPRVGRKSEPDASPPPSPGPKSGQNCYVTPTFSGVPNAKHGEKIRTGCLIPAFSGVPKKGGIATQPLHSRGSPTPSTGRKSEPAASSLPSRGSKRGRNCGATPAFSGVPKKGVQKRPSPGRSKIPPPPPCASTLKVIKTTVTRAPVLRQDFTRGTKRTYVTGNLPIPHPKHNCRNRALQHTVQANFSEIWTSSLPIRAIRSCGIEALSHLAPHLEQLHMLALWGSLWGRLGFRFWNGFRLPIPWDKTVINNIFGEVKLALKHMAKAHERNHPHE